VIAVPISDDQYDEFLELFRTLLHELNSRPSSDAGAFRTLLEEHLGVDPSQLPIVSDSYSPLEHPNLQVAVHNLLEEPQVSAHLHGILGGNRRFMASRFATCSRE
jgi:cell division protease FtsH